MKNGTGKQELIKPIVRVGNSAGVILPREWLDGKARVELVEKPIDIKRDVLEILDKYLEDIKGVYIVGSYARGDQTNESDVDILAITKDTGKRIDIGKYNIVMVRELGLENYIGENALPLIPMIREAKTIINGELIEKYKKKAKITRKNARKSIELAEVSLNTNKEFIDYAQEDGKNLGDSNSYSLVLHLRSLYLIDCLRKKKKWSTEEFKEIIGEITGSINSYGGYMRIKKERKDEESLTIKEANKLYARLKKEIEKQKKWLKERES